ncbi:protein CLN8-like [Littorina saxatilis]|uniref:TLC domain-containing protein n=1 Tax=Littorina saxatilis TaxID=31220 RepID=A0AAN9BAF1_9CAEN
MSTEDSNTSLSPELVAFIHHSLVSLDYSNVQVKVGVAAAGAIVFTALFFLLHVLFHLTTPVYSGLSLKHKVFWNLAVVRGVYGVFCTVVGSWAIFCHTGLEKDAVFATTPTSHLAMCVSVGFFVFECTAVTLSDVFFGNFSALLHVHHWLSLIGFIIVLRTDTGHTIGSKGLILEMSTPFSGVCWTLLRCGLEQGLLWKVNQFLLVHTFHLRSVAEVLLWYISWKNWDNIWANMPTSLFVVLYLELFLITVFMTPYWTYKKSRQMVCPVDWNFEVQAPSPVMSNGVVQNGHESSVRGGAYAMLNGSNLKQE